MPESKNLSRLRKVLCPAKNPYDGRGKLQYIMLDYNPALSIDHLLKLLIEDFKDGFFSGYSRLSLAITFAEKEEDGRNYVRDHIDIGSGPNAGNRLNELYKRLKTGKGIVLFKLGENLNKNIGSPPYDILVFITQPASEGDSFLEKSTISVSYRTDTSHLTPFIDGRVEDGTEGKKILVVCNNGGEVIRQEIYKRG